MSRPITTAAALVLALGALVVLPRERPALASPDDAAFFAPPAQRYHSEAEVTALVDSWIAADPAHVKRIDLAPSAGGRRAPALAFGARAPGDRPLEDRPTVILLGGLDGQSRAGGEAVLRATHALLTHLEDTRADLGFISVPWASPDGLARAASAGQKASVSRAGGDDSALDDDEDGRFDEDPPDDLDGDGEVLDLLIEDAAGPWTFASDERFLVPASEGDAPRLLHVREGRDDDGDGLWNEDGRGGVNLDAHFPVGWQGPGARGEAGRFPLEDALARSIADLALSRRTVLVLVFQGHHGGVARPGGTLGAELAAARDGPSFDRIAETFQRVTGRALDGSRSLRAAYGGEKPGASIDWFHGALGALAAEVAVWGPCVVGRDGRPLDPRLGKPPLSRTAPPPDPDQRRWARWLDEVRGGLGFAAWRPIELGIGRRAWVGGWRDRVDLDPPEDSLRFALEGTAAFVRGVVEGLPRLSVEVGGVERVGDLIHLRARVVNRGLFPTGLAGNGRAHVVGAAGSGAVILHLDAPCEEAVLAGDTTYELGVLAGGAAGPEHEWLILAPPGSTLRLTATAPGLASDVREVRP